MLCHIDALNHLTAKLVTTLSYTPELGDWMHEGGPMSLDRIAHVSAVKASRQQQFSDPDFDERLIQAGHNDEGWY